MKKAIAMKCSQKDWDSIKDKLEGKYEHIDSFDECKYLTNIFTGEKNCVSNISKTDKFGIRLCEEIHETFNAKIFLNACGIDCDVYEITKERILEIANWPNSVDKERRLKQWFPDAFKKELIIGKWYKCNYTDSIIVENKSLIFISEIDGKNINGYGFDFNGSWFDKKRDCGTINEHYKEATPQEVEAALICEIKKRYPICTQIKCLINEDIKKVIPESNVDYYFTANDAYYAGVMVFKDGIFAQIIETITIQEAEKLLNKKII